MKVDFNKIRIFNNEYLYVLEYQIKLQIDALKELVKDDEKSVKQVKENFNQFIKGARFKDVEAQHKDTFEEHLIDRELITQRLVEQKRYSTCLMVFSIFESLIKEVCSEIEQNHQSKIKHYDLKGNDDLSRYKKYLTKVIELDFRKIESSFTKIKQQKIVRNKIAHNNGIIENPNKIQIIQGIGIHNKRIIINDKSFFDFLIEAIEDFFERLLIEIDIKIKFR